MDVDIKNFMICGGKCIERNIMGRKIKIEKDYHGEDVELYDKGTITLEPGITVLIGCNGAGKTTLLHQIRGYLKDNEIPYLNFDNLRDGGSNSRNAAAFYGDFKFLASSLCSSEGENIALNLGKFAGKVGNFMRENADKNEVWILMDAVDSGLSVDAVVDFKEAFLNTIIEHFGGDNKEIYIIVTANEYELARGEKCFDVIRGKYVSVKSYEKYRNIILKSRESKDKRYEE